MSSNFFFAFLFAFGVFLMFASFRLPRTLGRRVVDRAAEEGPRMATFAEASLLQAMLADLSRKIAPERPTLVEQLRQSGWVFHSLAEYHFRRMVDAILFLIAALMVGLALRLYFDLSILVLAILASLAAILGFLQPDFTLRAVLNRRKEQLGREMGFGLERIALFLKSGAELSNALAQCQALGLFGKAAARLSVALKTREPIAEAVAEMRRNIPVTPAFEEFLELVRSSQQSGQSLVEPFQSTARQMRQQLQLDLIREGNRAKTKMVLITAGVIVIASLIVILVPMLLVLQTSGVF